MGKEINFDLFKLNLEAQNISYNTNNNLTNGTQFYSDLSFQNNSFNPQNDINSIHNYFPDNQNISNIQVHFWKFNPPIFVFYK